MKLSENISKDWLEIIETETKKPYFQEINTKINDDLNA
jgi:uracil DNA glycosylase